MKLNFLKLAFILNIFSIFFINDYSFACEKFVLDFSKDYCSQTKSIYNPFINYKNLRKKYHDEILSSGIDNKKLIANIVHECPEKKHYMLRFLRKMSTFKWKNK